MSVTIHLHTDLEKRLRQRAEAEGVHLDDYIVKTLEAQVSSNATDATNRRELELSIWESPANCGNTIMR